ncbi:MAG: ABC transporter ATP-binding protein [Nitrospira sp.]|nr:ABC transporter ATP-binding protein [Nitrospira sp.]MDE0404547.1 ABC transporter ATP-binding protein [Nitrospira sp.]MDE0487209.1 ABC transporter ATP-binding protein [Nitrospira sp.]
MNGDDPLVRFVNIQKSYDGETLVIKNLNLNVENGEFLTILGPSGSGKTTCLLMLAGFEPATHGEIYLKEQPINRVPPHKRGIGMVFQNYALFPHMTVAENLAFPLDVRGMSKSEKTEKVKRALDMVQLGGYGDRQPAQLSGGQQQRVAVARSLIFDPDLVLMDEPLGALDKNLREQMKYEIKSIHRNLGITVVYVTHDQSIALTLSDRIAVFDNGVIQQCAAPDVLYEQPENAFVANFIGENNQLIGTVVEDNGDTVKVDVNNGHIVEAKKVNVEGIGSRSTLSLRPERVVVGPEPHSLPNVFLAKTKQLIYLGDHIRTRFSICGSDDFIVKIPNSAVHAAISEGDEVKIGWKVEDCRAVDVWPCPTPHS